MYSPLIVKLPGESGIRETTQTPEELSVQPELTCAPSEEGPLRRTKAVGIDEGELTSSTVTVQVVDEPTTTSEGEQTMVVDVGSRTESITLPELPEWKESPE